MITVKSKDGCWRPYLSTDRNYFRACTSRPLREYLRQVLKKSDQRRCNNEIVTVLSGRGGDAMRKSLWTYGSIRRSQNGLISTYRYS